MPRIILVAATTGYQTRSFTAAAKRLGIDVTLATDRCHILEDPWRDHAIPVKFEEPELSARRAGDIAADGIVAVADRPTLVAALIAQRRGLPFHPPEAVAACRDKHRMREAFAAAGLLVPKNFAVPYDADPRDTARNVDFPCVLKPLGLSASRGVIRADDADQFAAAFHRIRRLLERPEIRQLHDDLDRKIQVESYIEGREFALEGLMTGGKLEILAIFDKPDPLEGPFFEESIYITPSREREAVRKAMVETTGAAVAALGLRHGPIHAEMRVNASGVFMLEVAARPIGGLCARALRFNEGLTLEELVIRHAIGDMPDALMPHTPAAGVMMIPIPRAGIFESVSGVDQARSQPGIDDVVITAKTGQKIERLPEGGSYPGFIFASGPSPGAVEKSIRSAHSLLSFEISGSLDII